VGAPDSRHAESLRAFDATFRRTVALLRRVMAVEVAAAVMFEQTPPRSQSHGRALALLAAQARRHAAQAEEHLRVLESQQPVE
jgi:hypothetical protein